MCVFPMWIYTCMHAYVRSHMCTSAYLLPTAKHKYIFVLLHKNLPKKKTLSAVYIET